MWKKTFLGAIYILSLLLIALLSQAFWRGDKAAWQWLNLLASSNEWHFASLVLFLCAAAWLWGGYKSIRSARDNLLPGDTRREYAHWFWVVTFGSWKRLAIFIGFLLASLTVLTVGCGVLFQPRVWQSVGAEQFRKEALDFWTYNLSSIYSWALRAVCAACLTALLCYWPAGDALGGIGSRRDHAVEQRRNLIRSWILVLISVIVLASLGALVGTLSLSLIHLFSSVSEFLNILASPFRNGQEEIDFLWVISGIFKSVWELLAWIPGGVVKGLEIFKILWGPAAWNPDRIGAGAAVSLTGCLIFYFYYYFHGERYVIKLLNIEKPTLDQRKRLIETIRRMDVPSHYSDARIEIDDIDLSPRGPASVPRPNIKIRLGVINVNSPNAFTFGRSRKSAHIVVTSGLLDLLSAGELRAVIAHEMGHILNRDTFFITLVIVTINLYLWAGLFCALLLVVSLLVVRLGIMIIVNAAKIAWRNSNNQNTNSGSDNKNDRGAIVIAGLALGGSIAILGLSFAAYLSVNLLALALAMLAAKFSCSGISQRREFAADAVAAELTNQPESLISALKKLHGEAHTASSLPRLAFFSPLCILDIRINAINESEGESGFFTLFRKKSFQEFFNMRVRIFRFLFRSHPPIDDRISRLEQMALVTSATGRIRLLSEPNKPRIKFKKGIKLRSGGADDRR